MMSLSASQWRGEGGGLAQLLEELASHFSIRMFSSVTSGKLLIFDCWGFKSAVLWGRGLWEELSFRLPWEHCL